MKFGSLRVLVGGDLRRNLRHFLLASIGIVVGIASYAFFLALGAGARNVVLGEIFPIDRLEVVPRSLEVDVGPLSLGMGADILGPTDVDRLRSIPGVEGVFPKMKLTVPGLMRGGEAILGTNLKAELVADGIDPLLVRDDVAPGWRFEGPSDSKASQACRSDPDCGDSNLYCGAREGESEKSCRSFVPVLASHHLVEIYNGVLRRAHSLPKLNEDFVIGITFDLRIGDTMVKASRRERVVEERGVLVGFSDKAIPLGVTMPLDWVSRFNVEYGGVAAAVQFHSIILDVASKDQVAEVAAQVAALDYRVADDGAERAGMLIAILMLVFGLVSVSIVGIAAINIMHVFFMLVYERKREIGIMRAVGASRADIRAMILSESAVVGLSAGSIGIGLAWGVAKGVDALSASYVPDFPYKPLTYFEFEPLMVASALLFAVGFCVVGALLPARRASRMDPAAVLTGQ